MAAMAAIPLRPWRTVVAGHLADVAGPEASKSGVQRVAGAGAEIVPGSGGRTCLFSGVRGQAALR
jgi:hypothetical protein